MKNHEVRTPKIAEKLVTFVRNHSWLSILLGLGFVGALVPGLSRITADFTHRGFFHADDPLLLAFDKFERQFGNDDSVVVAVHSPSGIFDKDSITLLSELTEEMWKVPEVIRVDSLTNYNWVHADEDELIVEPLIPDDRPVTEAILKHRKSVAMNHETLPDYLISKDARTALIFAPVKPGLEVAPDAPLIVGAVRKLVQKLKRTDHAFYISGGPAITLAFREASQQDFQKLIPAVLGVTILLLIGLLRSFFGVVLSLLVVFCSVIGAMGVSGWIGIQFNNITFILPQILIAIGVADAVHVLVVFRRAHARGLERKDAAEYSLRKNFLPTLITSITTTLGFWTFSTADLKPLSGLGILAGLGTLLAWLLTYFLLGGLLFVLPSRRPKPVSENNDPSEKRASRFSAFLVRARTPIMVGFGLCVVAAAFVSTKNTVNSDPFKYFQTGFWARTANEFIEAEVGGARGVELVIDSGSEEGIKDPAFLKKVDAFQTWLDAIPGVTRSLSIVDILKQTNRSLHQDRQEAYRLPDNKELIGQELFLYTMSLPQGMNINDRVTIKNDALRVTVLWTIASSKEVTKTIERIEAKGQQMGLQVSATGKNRLYQSMNGYVVRSFVVSITAAVVLISLVLMMFFRSWKLGLLAMLPNTIPLVIGGGVLWLIKKPMDIGVVLVMSVCLGIAVDDTIHILSNFGRLLSQGRDRKEAVTEVLAHTSPALIVTSVVLVTSFGTFAFATFTPNLYLGVMVAIILSVALVTDLTFLPALLLGSGGQEKPRPAKGGAA